MTPTRSPGAILGSLLLAAAPALAAPMSGTIVQREQAQVLVLRGSDEAEQAVADRINPTLEALALQPYQLSGEGAEVSQISPLEWFLNEDLVSVRGVVRIAHPDLPMMAPGELAYGAVFDLATGEEVEVWQLVDRDRVDGGNPLFELQLRLSRKLQRTVAAYDLETVAVEEQGLRFLWSSGELDRNPKAIDQLMTWEELRGIVNPHHVLRHLAPAGSTGLVQQLDMPLGADPPATLSVGEERALFRRDVEDLSHAALIGLDPRERELLRANGQWQDPAYTVHFPIAWAVSLGAHDAARRLRAAWEQALQRALDRDTHHELGVERSAKLLDRMSYEEQGSHQLGAAMLRGVRRALGSNPEVAAEGALAHTCGKPGAAKGAPGHRCGPPNPRAGLVQGLRSQPVDDR